VSEERELTIEQATVLLASRNVWRWSIVNMPRRQSVAEHTYLVTVIGLALYDQCMTRHSLLERASFFMYLMQHDAEEATLGDIPSPVKLAIERASPGTLTRVKREMGCEVRHAHSFDRTPLWFIAKIADHVEAIMFVGENSGPPHVLSFLMQHLDDAIRVGESAHNAMVDWRKLRSIAAKFTHHGT